MPMIEDYRIREILFLKWNRIPVIRNQWVRRNRKTKCVWNYGKYTLSQLREFSSLFLSRIPNEIGVSDRKIPFRLKTSHLHSFFTIFVLSHNSDSIWASKPLIFHSIRTRAHIFYKHIWNVYCWTKPPWLIKVYIYGFLDMFFPLFVLYIVAKRFGLGKINRNHSTVHSVSFGKEKSRREKSVRSWFSWFCYWL